MTRSDRPVMPAMDEALKSDPHENARQAEKTLDAPRRREQEEAMRNKDRATGKEESSLDRDVALNRPPD
jgi:hypothetical protein